MDFSYRADGAEAARFFASNAFVRGLRGPVGSGKSVACCIEVFRRALAQGESPVDGMKKSRWAIIRNTGPELKTTTIKTWLDWFPEHEWGKFKWSPPYTHHIKRGKIDLEVIFLALDKPEDVKKLLSLELTGAFINEAREVPKAIVDGSTMRVGRYPSVRDGGPTWCGVIMDTNSPDEDHWWAIMSGEVLPPDWMSSEDVKQLVKPDDWEFFSQPGAMKAVRDKEGRVSTYRINKHRENQSGVPDDYYKRMIAGKTHNWINVYVCNKYGSLTDGKPVYSQFDRELHVAKEPIPIFPGHDIYIGIDFGLSPAATFAQKVRGRWFVQRELVTQDMGIERFVQPLREMLVSLGRSPEQCSIWGDPAGDIRAQTNEDTPFLVLKANGIVARKTNTNDPALRIGAVERTLTRINDKKPALLIDPSCKNLIAGFEGGYHYRRLQVSGAEKFEEKPDKNRFSHVHDALQYMMLGGGEGREMLGQGNHKVVTNAKRKFDVFAHAKGAREHKPLINGW